MLGRRCRHVASSTLLTLTPVSISGAFFAKTLLKYLAKIKVICLKPVSLRQINDICPYSAERELCPTAQ